MNMKERGQILLLAQFGKENGQKLLGVNINRNLKVSHYILKECKKEGRNLGVLIRIYKLISLERQRVFVKPLIESRFTYCLLVWICCDKTSDNCMNHLDERARRAIYNKNVSKFEKFLEKDNSVTIHVRNLRTLAAELYKTKEDLAATIMHEIFE